MDLKKINKNRCFQSTMAFFSSRLVIFIFKPINALQQSPASLSILCIHLFFLTLKETGYKHSMKIVSILFFEESNNETGLNRNIGKIPSHSTMKDFSGFYYIHP